jgi:hypothetical protein
MDEGIGTWMIDAEEPRGINTLAQPNVNVVPRSLTEVTAMNRTRTMKAPSS